VSLLKESFRCSNLYNLPTLDMLICELCVCDVNRFRLRMTIILVSLLTSFDLAFGRLDTVATFCGYNDPSKSVILIIHMSYNVLLLFTLFSFFYIWIVPYMVFLCWLLQVGETWVRRTLGSIMTPNFWISYSHYRTLLCMQKVLIIVHRCNRLVVVIKISNWFEDFTR
jgi:hypothetical protein